MAFKFEATWITWLTAGSKHCALILLISLLVLTSLDQHESSIMHQSYKLHSLLEILHEMWNGPWPSSSRSGTRLVEFWNKDFSFCQCDRRWLVDLSDKILWLILVYSKYLASLFRSLSQIQPFCTQLKTSGNRRFLWKKSGSILTLVKV
jgi:hypothetical protein